MQLMQEARHGMDFSDWFVYATVIPARLFTDFVNIDPKTATMELRGSWRDYNFSTASPAEDLDRDSVSEEDKSLDNLYYIQLLRNELPSYHFWSHTSPVEAGGEMRHGLISKGASACYDIEGDDMISNVHINFNRLQNLPLRNGDPLEPEQITNADPNYSPKRSRARSRSPRNAKEDTVYRTRNDENIPRRANKRRARPRTTHDSSFKLRKGEGDEPQEVRVAKRKRRQAKWEKAYKPELADRIRKAFSDEFEEDED
jgi:hypothetical protein